MATFHFSENLQSHWLWSMGLWNNKPELFLKNWESLDVLLYFLTKLIVSIGIRFVVLDKAVFERAANWNIFGNSFVQQNGEYREWIIVLTMLMLHGFQFLLAMMSPIPLLFFYAFPSVQKSSQSKFRWYGIPKFVLTGMKTWNASQVGYQKFYIIVFRGHESIGVKIYEGCWSVSGWTCTCFT